MRVLSLCIDIEGCINRKYYFCTIYFYRKYLQKVEEKKEKKRRRRETADINKVGSKKIKSKSKSKSKYD